MLLSDLGAVGVLTTGRCLPVLWGEGIPECGTLPFVPHAVPCQDLWFALLPCAVKEASVNLHGCLLIDGWAPKSE